MKLNEILAVAGQPGLWKFVAQSTRGVIVESLADHRRMNVLGNARVSSMADITIFTDAEDRPLADVFTALYKANDGKPTVDHKADGADVQQAFAKAVPDFDRDLVHVSDMKKILNWYNILVGLGVKEFALPDVEGGEAAL